MNLRESLIAEGLLDSHSPEPRFRVIFEGLYCCEDEEFMKHLPKTTGQFISYQQLCQDRPAYKRQ